MAGPNISKRSEDRSTNVTTTTTTNVRDIGLTGQNAVDAIAAIENGAVVRTSIVSDVLKSASTDFKEGYNNLGAVTAKAMDTVKAESSGSSEKLVFLSVAALVTLAVVAVKR